MQGRSAETANAPVPLQMVGSSTFGRYPKINLETTINNFTADDFSINFAGYQFKIAMGGNGRGLYASQKGNLMFSVSDSRVYKILPTLVDVPIFSLNTNAGDVYIDEDILNNIAFVDGVNIYIYNYINNVNYIPGTNPYNVGTISQSGFTVTGVGTLFNTNSNVVVGGQIYFQNNTIATITSITDDTHLVVSISQTIASTSPYLITAPLDFTPNYIFFHDARFIATSSRSGSVQVGQWRLSQTIAVGNVSYIVFTASAQFQGAFQTKPDVPIAGCRLPGRQTQILILGNIVGNIYSDRGLVLFPYQINSTFNIDFGLANPATLCSLNNLTVWTAQNENSGIFLMYTTGEDIKKISTDGIDFKFETIEFPEQCYAFMYLQSGHLFYAVTFYNPADNITLAYDFNTGKFYNLTDEHQNYFIAKRVVYFNNSYYFISINDGNLYEINSQFTTYEYENDVVKEIPRSRITPTWRSPDNTPVIANNLWFTVEQGIDEGFTGQGDNIGSISVQASGSGYTTAYVLIEGDGQGATASINFLGGNFQLLNNTPFALLNGQPLALLQGTPGSIASIDVIDPGVGYTWAVTTIIGDGTGAFVSPILNVNSYVPRVDLSVSYDGGYTWSQFTQMQMNYLGKYKSRFYADDLGYGNEFTFQFRYWIKSRFVCGNGEFNWYR
jgi:hypothetical protein